MNNMFHIKSFYAHKEFYNLDYSSSEESELNTVDIRNTLFWSPSVLTNNDGEATVSIYSSDLGSSFSINIEGTKGNGLIGREFFTSSVQ